MKTDNYINSQQILDGSAKFRNTAEADGMSPGQVNFKITILQVVTYLD